MPMVTQKNMEKTANTLISIDFHAHILPRCDHGSDGRITSLEQLALAQKSGVNMICATPHFYPEQDTVNSFLKRRQACYEALCERLSGSAPRILLGAEVLICDHMDRMPDLEKLCLSGTNYLLLEMPFFEWPESLFETASRLAQLEGIQLVMAHADRYEPDSVEQLIDFGIPLQLNVDNLSKRLKNKRLLDWIDRGKVIALGSDIHGTKVGYHYWDKCKKMLGSRWDSVMKKTAAMGLA